jgi:hypothetical protein
VSLFGLRRGGLRIVVRHISSQEQQWRGAQLLFQQNMIAASAARGSRSTLCLKKIGTQRR